ncbi:MAG: sulfite exporter TauE/SafE family protein [Candidatus Lokiarchaeota archaeon]|nr:sulfite exporter TauE/SafE family protein [Candidatus Lokiarchaeota archaeon]
MDAAWILLFLFVAMFLGAAFGFGDALILIPFLTMVMAVQPAVVLTSFWGVLLNVMNAVKYRAFIDKPFLKKVVPIGLAGVIGGSLLIGVAPVAWIELVLGVFIACYVTFKARALARERLRAHVHGPLAPAWLYSGAAAYGFLGGLIGASGPVFVVILERTNHEREAFIENFALNSFLLTLVKLGIYTGTGLFPVDLWLVFLVGLPITYIATRCGQWLTPRIPKDKFLVGILVILAAMAIRFIVMACEGFLA